MSKGLIKARQTDAFKPVPFLNLQNKMIIQRETVGVPLRDIRRLGRKAWQKYERVAIANKINDRGKRCGPISFDPQTENPSCAKSGQFCCTFSGILGIRQYLSYSLSNRSY